jgi:hypothetical protein
MNEMYADPRKLFDNARLTPNPGVTGTNTTWGGHVDDLRARINKLWTMIQVGQLMGCDMSAEIAAASTLTVPRYPR